METNQTVTTTNPTNHTCSMDLTEEQYDFYGEFAWGFESVGALCVDTVGITLNIISIIIFASRKLRGSLFNQLLICLAIFDTLYLLSGISEAFRKHLAPSSLHQIVFVYFLYPIRGMMLFCSMYTTLALTVERYNAVVKPYQHRGREGISSWKRFLYYIGPVVLVSSVYYTPKFFDIKLKETITCSNSTHSYVQYPTNMSSENLTSGDVENCTENLSMYASDLRRNPLYVLLYINVSNLIMTCIIPIVMLIYLNFRIYKSLGSFLERHASRGSETNREERSPDKKQIVTLFAIVICFAICHTLRIVLNVEEMIYLKIDAKERDMGCKSLRFWAVIAMTTSEFLLQMNASINFILYCSVNENFRKQGHALVSRILISFQGINTNLMVAPQIIQRDDVAPANNIELQDMNAPVDI